MYTYVQRPGCKKENTATYLYIRAGSRTPTRAYVQHRLVYMAGSERRNSVVVVFMGRQRNASCSWGGNGMRHVHREGLDGTGDGNVAWLTTEQRKRPCLRPATFKTGSCSLGGSGIPQNGGNKLLLDLLRLKRGPADREGCGVPQNRGNGPPTVETVVLLIGRGVAYRKTEETDLLRSKRGSC